jgi:hypothetical protein
VIGSFLFVALGLGLGAAAAPPLTPIEVVRESPAARLASLTLPASRLDDQACGAAPVRITACPAPAPERSRAALTGSSGARHRHGEGRAARRPGHRRRPRSHAHRGTARRQHRRRRVRRRTAGSPADEGPPATSRLIPPASRRSVALERRAPRSVAPAAGVHARAGRRRRSAAAFEARRPGFSRARAPFRHERPPARSSRRVERGRPRARSRRSRRARARVGAGRRRARRRRRPPRGREAPGHPVTHPLNLGGRHRGGAAGIGGPRATAVGECPARSGRVPSLTRAVRQGTADAHRTSSRTRGPPPRDARSSLHPPSSHGGASCAGRPSPLHPQEEASHG